MIIDCPPAKSGFPIMAEGREILEIDVAMHCHGRPHRKGPTDHQIIVMRVRDGLTLKQIAHIVGVSAHRVRQRIELALQDAIKAQMRVTASVQPYTKPMKW